MLREVTSIACGAGALLAAAGPAFAQDSGSGLSVEGSIAAVSDYRYRGYSLSDRDPAVQGEVTVSTAMGFYGYGWASSVQNTGDNIELMGALGWSGDIMGSGMTADVGGGIYAYPGVSNGDVFEFYALFSQPMGMATLKGGVSYFPEQDNLAGQDNIYVNLGASTPLGFAGIEGDAGVGWEDGAYGSDKIDWTVGVTVPLKPLELRVAYVATNIDGVSNARDGALAELRYKFAF
jgi:uncharacterized protein (TIGR02001 family)